MSWIYSDEKTDGIIEVSDEKFQETKERMYKLFEGLSHSQGFYGRVLRSMKHNEQVGGDAGISDFVLSCVGKDDLDIILMLEGGD